VLPLLMAYVGSYIYLSRRGMREAQTFNLTGFLYVPIEEVLEIGELPEHDRTGELPEHYGTFDLLLSEHYRRATFYAPANWVDRTFFGGEGPVQSIN
jgi:hypothetical protein